MKRISTESRDAAIRGLRQYAADLRATLSRLREDLGAVERSLGLLEGATADQTPIGVGPYADLKPQGAVEKYLREHPTRKLKPSEITRNLLRLGLPKTSKAFAAAITGALMRATNKGIATKGKDTNDRNIYWYAGAEMGTEANDDEKKR